MIANPTTIILGAGASFPIFPLGSGLRSAIIAGDGAKAYEAYLASSAQFERQQEKRQYESLKARFRDSHVSSIDAFLAEPENAELGIVGHIAIAAALLPRESKTEYPDWYPDLFNAIRFRDDGDRERKLKVVTFNYDLSLENFLFHAFQNAYKLSEEAARDMLNATVEIIHVYGDLGELDGLSKSNSGREYGKLGSQLTVGEIAQASKRIKIIGRHDETKDAFTRAFQAIKDATFVGILGYGFDALNNGNLRLKDAAADKHPFATGFGLGSGARARLSAIASSSSMVMGGKHETVKMFLDEIDFFQWINEPGAAASDVAKKIMKVFKGGTLPYAR